MAEDLNDSEFLNEMQRIEADNKLRLSIWEREIEQLADILMANGIGGYEECYNPAADELVSCAADLAKQHDPVNDGKIDFGQFYKLLLMATFRASISMYEIARRKYDPAYNGDTDAPVGA